MKINKIILESIPSTNFYCKENFTKLNSYDVVIAKEQTAGYGRFNRQWMHEKGESIALSAVYKGLSKDIHIGNISIVISVSIINVLQKHAQKFTIKWPNDILLNGKKMCGILIDNIICNDCNNLIIGVGLNINNKDIPNSLKSKATSLYIQTNKLYDLDVVIDEISTEIFNNLSNLSSDYQELYSRYIENSMVIGKSIIVNGSSFKVIGINYFGDLITNDKNGKEIIISSGEVTLEDSKGIYK